MTLHAIAEKMGVFGGVPRVTFTTYPRSGFEGRYIGTTGSGKHRVSLSRGLDVGPADLVLLHELGHAIQCQRLGGPQAFAKQWWAEMREAGVARGAVRGGTADPDLYRSTPLESEAWDIAHDFYPFCERRGFIVRAST